MTFREFVLNEMPMQTGEGLALLVEGGSMYILFQNSMPFQRALLSQNPENQHLENAIFGVLTIRDNTLYNSDEVDRVWARKGFGPLMYLIAMQNAGKYGLMSSRVTGEVSNDASTVWRNFYEGAGKKFVKVIPLNAEHPHHEVPWLNAKYILKKPFPIGEFIMRGRAAFARDKHSEGRNLFVELADSMLRRKVDDVYGY